MSTDEQPARRRPRRAVREPGTVGNDESVLRSRHPAPPTPSAPSGTSGRASGAARTGTVSSASTDPDPWSTVRSADDSDRGWGREEPSSNDERLQRERPPHW